MPRFVCFGVPVGFEKSFSINNDKFVIDNLYSNHMRGTHFYKDDLNGELYYTYVKYADSGKDFFSSIGRPKSLFGMSIIFSKQEQQSNKPDDKNILKLLHQTYEQYVKGNIIEHYPNGNMRYKINHIECKDNKVAKDIAKAIHKIIERNPELDIFNEAPKKQTVQNTQGNLPNIIAMKKNDPRGK